MSALKRLMSKASNDVRTDHNWNRIAQVGKTGIRALPSGSLQHVLNKAPIVSWLPRYNWRWLINDMIAGITVGLMLIPQSLSYAKLAKIPVENGLAASWFPGVLYAIMGTTKDLSTGPTSLIGLLTSEQVDHFAPEDGDSSVTPAQVASAMALWMGVFGMILGFLNLGFLLDFISLPVLSGFISAVAMTIILSQIPSLLGEAKSTASDTAGKIHDVFAKLPTANGYACAIGFTGLLFLTVIEKCGKQWSDKNKFVWFMTITRAFTCLVLYTGISYAVNKKYDDNDDYLFNVAQVLASGIPKPELPPTRLITALPGRSIAVFIGAAIESTAIARGFAVRNNYSCDQTQELVYFGIVNFANSWFHAMGVGGAMSRTAVNSACKVKSPLSGIFTTAVVLITLYFISGALYWVPSSTLAAIIICAVWPLISSPKVFYTYWKTSLADFIASMIALWVCLFESTEFGIAAAVGFNIVYILLRQVFTRVTHASDDSPLELQHRLVPSNSSAGTDGIPEGIRVFRFNESFFFANAYRVANSMTDAIKTYHSPHHSSSFGSEADRNWSVAGEKRIARLRRRAGITNPSELPPIQAVILDFTKCNHIDATAVTQLKTFLKELSKYGGPGTQCRFVGMTKYVRERFERAGFLILDEEGGVSSAQATAAGVGAVAVRIYPSVAQAISVRPESPDVIDFDEKEKMDVDVEEVENSSR
ncbi:hypothetical protein CBER1_05465 [Cercospora berteroae]|uniref:STAS domain-containing protein n=1 Tax=Cercospora berteroae TaxID=357750 RepID=A0A2S6C9L6_9PEZI|nr:hypothetical protein CBER1_05465 [Cercospora berteroae]